MENDVCPSATTQQPATFGPHSPIQLLRHSIPIETRKLQALALVFGQKLRFRMWKLLSVLPQGPFQPGRGSHQRWWQGFRYFFCHFTIPYMFHNHVGVFSMLSNITPHPINPPNLDKMANFRIILTAWKMAYVLWLAISCNTAPFVKLAIFHFKWSI